MAGNNFELEFGAHQAVLVRTQQDKAKLPPELKGALVLTVMEAKGLEVIAARSHRAWRREARA